MEGVRDIERRREREGGREGGGRERGGKERVRNATRTSPNNNEAFLSSHFFGMNIDWAGQEIINSRLCSNFY